VKWPLSSGDYQAASHYRVALVAVAAAAVVVAAVAAAAATAVDVARRNASLFRHKNVACFALFTKCARRSTLLCKEGCTIYPKMAVANDDDWPAKEEEVEEEEERSGVALATAAAATTITTDNRQRQLVATVQQSWGCKCCQCLFICHWQLVIVFIVYGTQWGSVLLPTKSQNASKYLLFWDFTSSRELALDR